MRRAKPLPMRACTCSPLAAPSCRVKYAPYPEDHFGLCPDCMEHCDPDTGTCYSDTHQPYPGYTPITPPKKLIAKKSDG